eukprot:CAMPEP_0202894740 /NCGR_PEP_ID=MMETSP1392-20130828/4075_1 /ASSEMBLY_ACC=CAM_ASM_000868 /TAXON_ID=225041 /ORGANISM="Chlamydomonas chlamydogama, Strain SAG 11-48b" /LENGTH=38 /DNA_ID= /DNA_START= /DNA_END= /DNA_ORIENTATION=
MAAHERTSAESRGGITTLTSLAQLNLEPYAHHQYVAPM